MVFQTTLEPISINNTLVLKLELPLWIGTGKSYWMTKSSIWSRAHKSRRTTYKVTHKKQRCWRCMLCALMKIRATFSYKENKIVRHKSTFGSILKSAMIKLQKGSNVRMILRSMISSKLYRLLHLLEKTWLISTFQMENQYSEGIGFSTQRLSFQRPLQNLSSISMRTSSILKTAGGEAWDNSKSRFLIGSQMKKE